MYVSNATHTSYLMFGMIVDQRVFVAIPPFTKNSKICVCVCVCVCVSTSAAFFSKKTYSPTCTSNPETPSEDIYYTNSSSHPSRSRSNCNSTDILYLMVVVLFL